MSVKEIKEAIEKEKVCFGIKQTLKNCSGKKKCKVFVCRDTRDDTLAKLDAKEIEYEVLKSKTDVAKELNLDFENEVFCLK